MSNSINVLEQLQNMGHEQIMFFNDEATGLKGIIGVHNTVLGPALGGTRMWNYNNETEALTDVLRLSRGMTLKASACGVNLGGGKAVLIGDSKKDTSEAFWRRYGMFVDNLGGKYITAEDVGTSPSDIEYIAQETEFVAGKPKHMGGSGDPSPVTAYGTYLGIKASVKKLKGNDSLQGMKATVQGVGHVGQYLVDHLVKDGAKVFISDINEANLKATTSKHSGVEVVGIDEIYGVDAEIYAPCALGATVNDDTISKLKCSIIAGAANNQLKSEEKHGKAISDKGIIYAPDFLINAGGLINCYTEVMHLDQEFAMAFTEKIYERTLEVFNIADANRCTTHEAAVTMAMNRINAIAKLNATL